MLDTATRQHLADYTCLRCGDKLGRFHVYCLTDPADVLRQTTERAPMHLHCAQEFAEAVHRDELAADPAFPKELLYVLYTVKASPSSPSAKVIRLIETEPGSACLHLFSPETIRFYHQRLDGPHVVTRPAEYAEIESAMIEALKEVATGCSPEEAEAWSDQIARLHKYLPQRPKQEPEPEPT